MFPTDARSTVGGLAWPTRGGQPSSSLPAAVFVALAAAGGLWAQPVPSAELGVIRCSVSASEPLVRIEGTSELVGDIVLTCHNSEPSLGLEASGFVELEVALSLNVDMANRTAFGLGADVSDAVLVVNENNCAVPGAGRHFGGCPAGSETVQAPMPGRRESVAPKTVRWTQVALPIPGAAAGRHGTPVEPVADCRDRYGLAGGCHPTTTTLRLTNLRANAAQLGVSGAEISGSVAIEAALEVLAEDAAVVLEEHQVTVAHAAPGILAAAETADADRLCSHGETVAHLSVVEGFAAAFKEAGGATFHPGHPGWDEGYYPFSQAGRGQGFATSPTRLRIGLTGIPEGVEVTSPASVICSSPEGLHTLAFGFVAGTAADGSGGQAVSWRAGDRMLADGRTRSAVAVYEVSRAQSVLKEECRIPIRFARTDGGSGSGWAADVTVSTHLVPAGRAGPGDAGHRFAVHRRQVGQSFHLHGCGTRLLFPFVTNRSNFETAIVITNTSADPLGTRHQAGRCILRYQGAAAAGRQPPAPQTTLELEAGRQLAFTLTSGNPEQGVMPVTDFQGYLVTECDFQHAQGFAFVTEQINGAAVLAQGYLAEVLAETAAPAQSR